MEAIIFFFGLILMILVLIQTIKSVRIDTGWKKLDNLVTSLTRSKEGLDYQVGRFNDLLRGLTTDQGRYSSLKAHIRMLESESKELEEERNRLENSCVSMKCVRDELEKINSDLAEKIRRQRDEILQNEEHARKLNKRIGSLKETRKGLELVMHHLPAEEVCYLSQPVSDMGVMPTVRQQLAVHGIVRIGDLVGLDEQDILSIAGVGTVTLETIKARMEENGVSLDMDVVRIGNRWYRRKQEQTNTD